MEEIICSNCGTKVSGDTKFCGVCGAKIVQPEPAAAAAASAPQQPVYQAPPVQPVYQAPPPAYQAAAPQSPALTAPMSTGAYIGTMLLFCLPVIGLILMLVWAFGSGANINRKNFSRAYLIFMLVALVLSIIFGIVIWSTASALMGSMGEFAGSLGEFNELPFNPSAFLPFLPFLK